MPFLVHDAGEFSLFLHRVERSQGLRPRYHDTHTGSLALRFRLSIVGAYALDSPMFDVLVALVSGVVGFFMRRYGFSVVPLAIGLILGGMLEQRLGQSMVMLDEKWWLMFTRPLTLLFLVLTALALFGPLIWRLAVKRRSPHAVNRRVAR